MREWRKKLANLVIFFSNKQKLLIGILGIVGAIYTLYQFNWSGFGEDSNKSVTVKEVINPKDGKIIKLTEVTENFQSGKTFWDWLGLTGTLAIPVVLFQFERREQRRADKQSEAEKAIADNNLREEVVEAYIDRMSELLLDKKLKNLASDDPLRETALDVARARTLSVLRKLDKDRERKSSVIQFLIDAELVRELDLSGADLTSADLLLANLTDANLFLANFTSANLLLANLSDTNLSAAKFFETNLSGTNLSGANLSGANLSTAKNMTPDQIKSAKNWEKAIYDEDFRAELGLPTEDAE